MCPEPFEKKGSGQLRKLFSDKEKSHFKNGVENIIHNYYRLTLRNDGRRSRVIIYRHEVQ